MFVKTVAGPFTTDQFGRPRDALPVKNYPPGQVQINGIWRDVIPVELVADWVAPDPTAEVHPVYEVAEGAFGMVPVSGLSSELAPIQGVSNWTRENNTRIMAALANLKAGTGDARALFIGDSTTAGVGANGVDSWTAARVLAVPSRTAVALVAAGVPAVNEEIMGRNAASPLATWGSYIGPGMTVTRGVNWADGLASIGGAAIASTGGGTTGVLTFTSSVLATACRVTAYQYTAAGAISFQASFDGGATWTAGLGAAGNNGMQILTFVNPGAPSYSVQLRRITGAIGIQGVEMLDTTTKKLRLVNAGQGSSTTSTWSDVATAYAPGNTFGKVGADLITVNLTINDRAGAPLPNGATGTDGNPDVNSPMGRIQAIINTAHAANSDIWLSVPNPGNNVGAAVLTAYRNAIIALAAVNNVPCLDLMDPLDTLAKWQAPTNMMYDGIHPNGVGYDYIAQRWAAMLAALYAAA